VKDVENRSLSLISMDLAHFDAAVFARPARRPMVVVRLPNTGYRGCEGVVKFWGPTADGKVARRGAPQNVRASITFSTTVTRYIEISDNDLFLNQARH
jgi:hypothetical protein